ncbi:MAG: aminoacyl-tRNA hydrolase [bacterium]|nr:aminoacyl-tRNA hydrolase [bacterium]
MFIIVGLGNPGEEYADTRHNTGAILLEKVRQAFEFPDWTLDAKTKSLQSGGTVKKEKVRLLFPQTFMNKSGASVAPLVKSKKAAERLVVIHDDLDIPSGSYKISFNKSSGGHRGVESIIKGVKTEGFVRVRVGISPFTKTGVKKPKGEAAVEKHILGKFTPDQLAGLQKLSKRIHEVLLVLIAEGREKAMSMPKM